MPVAEAREILFCALRPEGSVPYLGALVLFVLLAWRLAPAVPRRPTR